MKEIKLSKKATKYIGFSALVDDRDFDELNKFNWTVTKSTHNDTFYAYRHIFGEGNHKPVATIKMHRVIIGVTDSEIDVDHRDGNGLNNQRGNLRLCNASQNAANAKSRIGSTSKYLGVGYDKTRRKWRAQIMKDYKQNFLGRFHSEVEAAAKYNEAAIKIHGEFASLNIF